MKKNILSLLVLVLAVLCFASVCIGVLSIAILNEETDTPGVELDSETDDGTDIGAEDTDTQKTWLIVLDNNSTDWFDTHTVTLRIISSRDDIFFVSYTSSTGETTCHWTTATVGCSFEETYEVVDHISFNPSGSYRVIVDGVAYLDLSEVPINKDTVIELILV